MKNANQLQKMVERNPNFYGNEEILQGLEEEKNDLVEKNEKLFIMDARCSFFLENIHTEVEEYDQDIENELLNLEIFKNETAELLEKQENENGSFPSLLSEVDFDSSSEKEGEDSPSEQEYISEGDNKDDEIEADKGYESPYPIMVPIDE